MSERSLRINLIFAAFQKVTSPMRAVAMGAKGMSNDLKKSTDALAKLNREQANITGFRTLKVQLGDTGKQLAAAKERVTALGKEIAKSESPTRKMTREFGLAKKEASELKAKFGEQQGALQRLRRSLNDAGIGTTGLSEHQKRLRADIGRTSAEIDQQKAKLGALKDREDALARGKATLGNRQALGAGIAVGGGSAVGAGVALAAPVVGAAKAAMTFESRMIDVQKVLNNVSPGQLKGIESGLLEMSGRIPIAAEGLGQIAAEGARAGIAVKDLLGFTEGAAKMATAFDISAEEAGAMQAKWQTGLGLTIPQITLLGDKVNALTNKFGGAAVSVTDMITRVGPLGKIAGVQSGEMAALAQLMTKVGVESEIGATGIKRMMLTLNVGEAATKTQSAAFSKLGLDAVEMSKRMQVDAKGGILSVLDALNKLPKAQRAGTLTQLFGSESVASIAPLLSSLDQLKMNFALVGDQANYAGSMNREFGVAMSKTENQVKLADNSIGSAGVALGTQLIPTIKIGAEWIRKIGIGIGGWAKEHPELTRVIGLTVGAAAGLLIVVGGLALVVGAVLGPFALLRYSFLLASPAAGIFSGALGFVKVGLWRMIGFAGLVPGKLALARLSMIKAGSAALGLARNALIASWGWLKMVGGMALGGLKMAAGALLNVGRAALIMGRAFLLNPVVLIVTGIALAALAIYNHWDKIGPYFWAAMEGLKQLFLGAVGWFKAIFWDFNPAVLIYTHWDKITAWFGNLWAGVKTVFAAAWEGIKGLMSGWADSALGVGAGIIGAIGSGIRNGAGPIWEALKSTVFGAINRVKEFFGGGSGAPRPQVPTGGLRTGPKLAGARALGGPVLRGMSYLVGERGPEIFTADGDGQITPNDALGGRTSRSFVTGTAIAALAASPAYASPARPAGAPNGGGDKYTIVINAKDAGSPKDIAAAVRREIESIEREKDARRRSSYSDDY
jgi:TP901 family phage tail tape measure protein